MSKMGTEKAIKNGICGLYRANVQSMIVFAAIHQAKMDFPEQQLVEIVERVRRNFRLEMTSDNMVRQYHRLLEAFLDNNGA